MVLHALKYWTTALCPATACAAAHGDLFYCLSMPSLQPGYNASAAEAGPASCAAAAGQGVPSTTGRLPQWEAHPTNSGVLSELALPMRMPPRQGSIRSGAGSDQLQQIWPLQHTEAL